MMVLTLLTKQTDGELAVGLCLYL